MDNVRTLPRPLDWRLPAFAIFAALNLGIGISMLQPGPHNGDWQLWATLDPAEPYARAPLPFVWSVPAAYLMAGVATIGYWPWFILHYAVLGLLWRTPWVMGIAAVSWPMWADATEGNIFVFVFVAGALALQGSRPAAFVYLALCALIPRPVQLPLALWLMWRMPETRLPALAMGFAVLGLSWGHIEAWITAVRGYVPPFNMSPTHFVGAWWFVVGIPLGAWLTLTGRVGWAGLAISPYVMPYYLLVALLEGRPRQRQGTSTRWSRCEGSQTRRPAA